MKWDIFVSHAYEDKVFARALADALSLRDLSVWFDEFELKVGDSLRRSIDSGLSESRFGIVILSPDFFAKEWTKKELDALTSRESEGEKIILPIWHNISAQEIRKYSPMLADRFAIDSAVGIEKIVEGLLTSILDNELQLLKNNAIVDKRLEAELEEAMRSIKIKEIELRAILAQADEVSHTDEMTFLPNRRQVIDSLKREVHRAERYKTSLSISVLDIDNFKNINDGYGYTVGDQILIRFADMMREGVRESDMVGRYEGDKFIIIMPNSTQDDAIELAENLCQQIRSNPIIYEKQKLQLTVSIGISQHKISEESWQELLDRAFQALYQAKRNGRDQWFIIRDT